MQSVEFVSFCITVGYDGTQSLLAPCFIAHATYILFWKETGNVHVCGATFNTPHCYALQTAIYLAVELFAFLNDLVVKSVT